MENRQQKAVMTSLPKFDYLYTDGGVFKYKDSYGTFSVFLLFEHKRQLYERKISFLCSAISFLIHAANTMKMSGLCFESHFSGKRPLSVCVSLFAHQQERFWCLLFSWEVAHFLFCLAKNANAILPATNLTCSLNYIRVILLKFLIHYQVLQHSNAIFYLPLFLHYLISIYIKLN